MFIQTETTPNPETLKFLTGNDVMGDQQSLTFNAIEEAHHAPFVQLLFYVDGVKSVLLGSDYIAITKETNCEWCHLKPFLFHEITQALIKKIPFVADAQYQEQHSQEEVDLADYKDEEKEIVLKILSILKEYIRPAVARDGGDVRFVKYEDNKLFLKMQGACSGCPSASITLKEGIERTLKYYIPSIEEIHAC